MTSVSAPDNIPELFPFTLLRIAGGPLADLQATEIPKTATIAQEIFNLREQSITQANFISEKLYELIPGMTDDATRRLWITVRRSVHNQKILPDIPWRAFRVLPVKLQRKLQAYIELHTELQLLHKQAEKQYETEIKSVKRAFARLLRESDNFQNGLLLSSSTIGASLEKYLASDPSQKTAITKKERSFMEYLSRMYTKPTPFSSFTHLAIAEFTAPHRSQELITFKNFDSKGYTHLNHRLYKILDDLLMSRQEVKQLLPVRLNPTIQRTGNAYDFLTNRHNQEAFQHITATAALDIFYIFVSKAPRPLSYQELVTSVVGGKHINAPVKEVALYLDQLLELGFFELHLGVSGIDREWNKKLLQRLSPLADAWPALSEVVAGLTRLGELSSAYATASIKERRQLLDEGFAAAQATCRALGAIAKKSKEQIKARHKPGEVFRHTYSTDFNLEPHNVWYEDTVLAERPILSSEVKASLDALGGLLARTASFDSCLEEQAKMVHFFKIRYGSPATVNILQFYQDYSPKKEELKSLPATARRHGKNKKLLDTFMERINQQSSSDKIIFGGSAITHLDPIPGQASFASFFQVYYESGSPRIVLNATAEGSGKLLSRFLHLFDSDITHQLQQASSSRTDDVLFAEVTDASFSNANLHPRIMPYEIITPGGHAALPPPARLAVNELTVSIDEGQSRLRLYHKPSGKEVIVFDLGFEAQGARSGLYRLLCSFGFLHHGIRTLLKPINERFKVSPDSESVVVLPRITYENQIILQRKTWRIPKNLLPVREASQSDSAYFLRLQLWRRALGLPNEVFVRGAYYKPQYVSFKNPLLLSVFETSIRGCQDALRIEEMLPHSQQLPSTGARVVECLAQWSITT